MIFPSDRAKHWRLYFELRNARVLQRSNQHLGKMSRVRYQIKEVDGGGLDILESPGRELQT
jgi:hypothetical protein